MDRRTITLSITQKYNNDIDYTYEKDLTDMSASDIIGEFVKTLKLIGYHDISLLRALKNEIENQKEYIDSIIHSKDELED
jgi:hypothetical protein